MHRSRKSTSDEGHEIVESIDLQPPEAIICWDGLEASDVRPRPRNWPGAFIVSVVLVALGSTLTSDYARRARGFSCWAYGHMKVVSLRKVLYLVGSQDEHG
jgi:hypothetical protein